MDKESVKTIKKGQCIEFKYMPDSETTYVREVKGIDKSGNFVHIEGIIKDTLFPVMREEIIDVIDCDTEIVRA
jgi:hypothetical protein